MPRMFRLLSATLLFVHLSLAAAPARTERIIIGAEDDAAPWSYADGSGYVNDLVRAAFAAEGWEVQLDVMPYARCKALVLNGSLAACFSASRKPELAAGMLYPRQPVFEAHNVLYARADSPLNGCNPQTWQHRPLVGMVNGYEYIHTVETLRKRGDLQPDISDSEAFSLRKLAAGRIDAALITVDKVKRVESVAIAADVLQQMKVVCDFGGEPAYVVFSQKHPQGRSAMTAFEHGMAMLHKTGAVARLQESWRKRLVNSAAVKRR